jgi:hypothetical protein
MTAALPPARRAEVEQFVAFVAQREREARIERDATAASAPVFASISGNADDSTYDAL